MSAEETTLPYEEKMPHVAAAMYLAVIAYPHNLKKRTDFVRACQAWWIKGASGRFPKGQVHHPDIAAYSEQEKIMREFARASRIMVNKRKLADEIAMFGLFSQALPVKIGGKDYSIKACLEAWCAKKSKGDEKQVTDNAYMRVWKDSLPVIHLMMGLRNAVGSAGIKGKYDLIDLLQNPRWVKTAVQEAEKVRALIMLSEKHVKKTALKENQMIRLLIPPAA